MLPPWRHVRCDPQRKTRSRGVVVACPRWLLSPPLLLLFRSARGPGRHSQTGAAALRGQPRCRCRHRGPPSRRARLGEAGGCRRGAAAGRAQGLRLHVQRLALQRPAVDGHEASDVQRLAGLHEALDPLLDLRVLALAGGAAPLRDDLAALVLHQRVLLQAADRLLLAAAEDERLGHATLGDLRHPLDLHDLHDLHGLHGCGLLHRNLGSRLHGDGHRCVCEVERLGGQGGRGERITEAER
mmetsp:Transcript_144922/g.464446  ORF Transcript_144922/g.464446 Transcript_144922/m.464446 type:complete len:241 (+) Transcript_144922:310-1032(+)